MESKKYPRTPHLPFSPGATKDDRVLSSVESLLSVPVVLLEKMDGSNLCMTRESVYARSHLGAPTHESFDLAKQLHAQVRHAIPDELSVFGEYLFAVHSIRYTDLPGYFLVFGVREDATGKWWSWEMVEEMATELGLPTVPVLAKLHFETEKQLLTQVNLEMACKSLCGSKEKEGVVIRLAGEITDFGTGVAKYVRAGHVTSSTHWAHQEIIKNELAKQTPK